MTVDLDLELLAAELRAAGYDTVKHPEHYHGGTKLFSNKGIGSTLIVYPDGRFQAGQTMMTDDHWPALDIIRRHVAPEPSRRAAVDTEAVMDAVVEFGIYRADPEYFEPNGVQKRLAAIRAMLEPHDAARLRETIAEIIARKAFRWNESVVGSPYRSMSEEDRCKDIADAVIRAIGGAR